MYLLKDVKCNIFCRSDCEKRYRINIVTMKDQTIRKAQTEASCASTVYYCPEIFRDDTSWSYFLFSDDKYVMEKNRLVQSFPTWLFHLQSNGFLGYFFIILKNVLDVNRLLAFPRHWELITDYCIFVLLGALFRFPVANLGVWSKTPLYSESRVISDFHNVGWKNTLLQFCPNSLYCKTVY